MAGIIHSDEEHAEALASLDRLLDLDPAPGSPEADDLQASPSPSLIEDLREGSLAHRTPDPVDAVRFRMDQLGLTRRSLEPYIGSRARVSEVLSGKRALSLRMIRALHAGLDIPLEVLVQEPRHERRAS